MALTQTKAGEILTPQPLGPDAAGSTVLIKSEELEVLQMVLRAGEQQILYETPADLVIHCLQGRIALVVRGSQKELRPGQLMYLPLSEPYAVNALEDASLLLTVASPRPSVAVCSIDIVEESSRESFPASD